MAEFDKGYWEDHWSPATSNSERELPVNPYLVTETAHLHAGTALDAGCGTGSEALWLAQMGWEVTGADISATALATAQARAATRDVNDRIAWIETDLSYWEPERTWDLVVTSYAHAQIGQLSFYRRIARWVAPGGTLLIVGHLHGHHHDDHPGHDNPEGATATLAAITNLFAAPEWRVEAGYEHTRTVHPGGPPVQLRDVIVRTHRLV
ncbi:class I SAM-dependent methyltransferase [Isoptericola sp. BMS4]|uniref:class I SAM-dependent methyltransferase n=1 Tax=Isoptericola sp. BMS4 TaxID=2527875 RepID=UPI00141EA23E|nr:class I SAM-dependent methyltransferase [Isoptericola sp. BMS4]